MLFLRLNAKVQVTSPGLFRTLAFAHRGARLAKAITAYPFEARFEA